MVLLLLPMAAAGGGNHTYKSLSTDQAGRFHIYLTSGDEAIAPKVHGQVGFANPLLSPDGDTAGWLALYPFPRVNQTDYDPDRSQARSFCTGMAASCTLLQPSRPFGTDTFGAEGARSHIQWDRPMAEQRRCSCAMSTQGEWWRAGFPAICLPRTGPKIYAISVRASRNLSVHEGRS